MDALSPNIIEYGVLGFLCCYLVMKGVPAMKDLSVSLNALSDVISKLQAQLDLTTRRIDIIDHRLDKIETFVSQNQLQPKKH